MGDAVTVIQIGAGVEVTLERGRQVTSEHTLRRRKEAAMCKARSAKTLGWEWA